VSTNRVNRYTTTDSNYSLEVGVQSQSNARPGFADDSTRASWTFNSNGTNTTTLNVNYSPSNGTSPDSKQSIIGLQAKASDPALKSYQGIPATQCKAVYTGTTTQTISAQYTTNRYDVETSFYTTDVYGLYRSPTSWIRTVNGVNDIVYNNDKGIPKSYTFPSRTLTVTGSDIFLANANQNQLTTGNNISRVNISVSFDTSSTETFTHSLSSTGTLVRTWEAYNHIIDGLNGDDALEFNCVSTLSATGALTKHGQSDQTSQFSLNEESKNLKISAPVSLSSSSTLTVTPFFIIGFTKSLESTTNLLASTANLKLGEANIAGSSTLSVSTAFKHGDILSLTSAFTQTQSAGLIYDINADYSWNTFNLNIYFESGFVEDGFVSDQGEYNWNFLENSAWDDWPTITWIGNESTWDNWPDDVWEQSYTLDWRGVFTSRAKNILNVGNALEYTGVFALAENSAYEQEGIPDVIESTFATNFTANGIIDVSIDMSGAFAPDLTANIEYALDEGIFITGAFNAVLTANAITDTFADIDAAFTFAVEPTFKPSGESQFAVEINSDFLGNEIYGPSLALSVLASELSIARLFYQADPWNIYKVKQEIRTVMVPAENRQTLVNEENRVNMITAETRAYLVPQETRSLKLRRPPFSNIYATPRIRSEQ